MPANPVNLTTLSATEKLEQLLQLTNIEEVYYIDDLFEYEPLPELVSHAKDLFDAGDITKLNELFDGAVKTSVPDADIFGNEVENYWEGLGKKAREEVIGKMDKGAFNKSDYERTDKLKSYFPPDTIQLVSPDKWEKTLKEIEKKYRSQNKKVLILFDQELKFAEGERFRNGTVTGIELIASARNSKASNNIVCALITHLITEVSKELPARDKLVDDSSNALMKDDFFALTKKRINYPEKLCDGIKKVLLNEHCELIKVQATDIIKDAYKQVVDKLHKLDTYDFDHIILRSSYGEGVWEVNTLMRIANNLFDQEIEDLMVKKKFAKSINPAIKKSKELSDITFTIPANHQPYNEKLTLRHHDIYHAGDRINGLHQPLENGDIFEVYEGTGKGLYILVAQECDLMMRTNKGGKQGERAASTAMLLKLKTYKQQELQQEMEAHFKKAGMVMHYYANKFQLEYFVPGKKDVGVVLFTQEFRVDLDVLDLVVFNADGKALINLIANKFDTDLVSASWEMRYHKLHKHYVKQQKRIVELLKKTDGKLDKPTKQLLVNSIGCGLAPIRNLGKPNVYNDDKFEFGIKRVMRLKKDGATYLLDRYYKHLSRKAEPHDFVS